MLCGPFHLAFEHRKRLAHLADGVFDAYGAGAAWLMGTSMRRPKSTIVSATVTAIAPASAMVGTRGAQALLGHATESMTADYIRHKVGKKVKPPR